ncbi:hypothetical protein CYLTODRAFT_427384 [Cylindrobasidium torrendii FP15055 ss-10]|uniref:Arrestin C-terminal-like domain-containing protein n=1 Tax=Cylindrobasidium torrendii FP15055 ss-10 TaxID=1314674 RepID=A0A0D7AWS1_9AGAR|nr:hypothetical protein CYLTODRAFT_427384 [Cylindrobasidium torrendii FP15055 ss-10]
MVFSSRPPSPSHQHIDLLPDDEVHTGPQPPFHNTDGADVHDAKERPRLEILLDKEVIYLKGTGVDVEPSHLSGHVALYLDQPTSIREITLQFRGKARLPPHESITLSSSPLTYILCNHEWSFLEGEKKHNHTLKPGRHLFPFQLQLGGSLPSSIWTALHGGAWIAYKLRAHAVRPGLAHNLQTVCPVTLVRSFAAEALEYQQTLEIENTWPEKLMYSIMVPHKAWAAGDSVTALVKFSPLVKGVGVLSINSTIQETIKLYARSGSQEVTKTVASVRHELINGKAVEAHELEGPQRHKPPVTPGFSLPSTPNIGSSARNSAGGYFGLTPGVPTFNGPTAQVDGHVGPSGASGSYFPPVAPEPEQDANLMSSDDTVTYITFKLPTTITPSHGLDPINVSHRIRWSILILNLDGHTSELRCSLPIHILDSRLLDEARSYTAATRRLLIGGPDVPPEPLDDDMELPSYNAHVRDRIANMYMPEGATLRVTNPWMSGGGTPAIIANDGSASRTHSGTSSPLDGHLISHLPHAPGSDDSTPLDWVNSELLLSIAEEYTPGQTQTHFSPTHTPSDHSDSNPATRPSSRRHSRANSRAGSRASSPERSGVRSPGKALHIAGPNETYIHAAQASRSAQGLFKATMKPFTSLSHPAWLSRSHSHQNVAEMQRAAAQQQQISQRDGGNSNNGHGHPVQTPGGRQIHLTDAPSMHQVPDYQVASRGFIGGVPPLSSMAGLPSYDDVERSQSESNLAGRFQSMGIAAMSASTGNLLAVGRGRSESSSVASSIRGGTDGDETGSAPDSPLMMASSRSRALRT